MNIKISQPYIVIQSTHAPYSTSASIDSMDAALAASNIGLTVVYIFMYDGVFQLLSKQQNQSIGYKSVFKKLMALPLFDVELLFAQASAVEINQVSLDDIAIDVTAIDDSQIVTLCENAQHVLVF
jgi:tRNA 2-thiouridine synthesizing protein C